MRCGSLFSGIGGFDLGFERAGHEVAWQVEIDAYRRRVLNRHWPDIPCYEDVRAVGRDNLASVDIILAGFPCQDLSVAGRRAGLAGERSGLFHEFARIADELVEPGGWICLENVPGLLSSHGGRDFAVLLSTLAELGFHDLAWRVLDSRYFGVPQRRRRVFILARRSRGRSASEVLLEPESGGGDFEAGGEAGPRVAASLSKGSSGAGVSAPGRRQEDDENIVASLVSRSSRGKPTPLAAGFNTDGHIVNALDRRGGGADDNEAQAGQLIARPLTASERWDGETETFIAGAAGLSHDTRPDQRADQSCPRHGNLEGLWEHGGAGRQFGSETHPDRVRAPSRVPRGVDVGAFNRQSGGDVRHGYKIGSTGALHKGQVPAVLRPEDHRPDINSDGGRSPSRDSGVCAFDPRPDGPRYAACGDAVTVNVSYWIGRRLMEYA